MDKLREEIYLQIGEGQDGEDRTWCEDKINDTDVKYIRADLLHSHIERAERKILDSLNYGIITHADGQKECFYRMEIEKYEDLKKGEKDENI